jgi:hypothetical protein
VHERVTKSGESKVGRDESITVGDSAKNLMPPAFACAKFLVDPYVVAGLLQQLDHLIDLGLVLANV